ncbi:MAG: hypothetical protein KAJ19_23375 [Gammaproteobacteria bacterium]|nr:hypothetical protein [Gammaproteobacteria bacterium]
MTKPAYMSPQLHDILTTELEYQHSVMREHCFSYEMHRSEMPGYDDGYHAFCEAHDEARLIRQQTESIMRSE